MSGPEWHKFDGIDTVEPLPPVRRYVLVQVAASADGQYPPSVAVGYLKYGAGDKDSPYFVLSGFGRVFVVTHWSDSLGDDFTAPLWSGKQWPTTEPRKSHARLEWENQELRRALAHFADDVSSFVDKARELADGESAAAVPQAPEAGK